MTLSNWIDAWPIFVFILLLGVQGLHAVFRIKACEKELETSEKRSADALEKQKVQFDKEMSEMKLQYLQIKTSMWEQNNNMNEKLSKVLSSLSKIEGKLEGDGRHGSNN